MESSKSSFVEVAVPIHLRKLFYYRFRGSPPEPGTRVLVPFRSLITVGWVVGPGREVAGVRNITAVLDTKPSLGPELLALGRWLADYYVAPLGLVLRAMLPAPMTAHSRSSLVRLRPQAPEDGLSPVQQRILANVGDSPEGRLAATVRRQSGKSSFWPHVRTLVAKGLLAHSTKTPNLPTPRTRAVVHLTRTIGTLDEMEHTFARAPRQRIAYERLQEAGGHQPLAALLENGFSRGVVTGLVARGVAEVRKERFYRDPFRDRPDQPPGPTFSPTAAQREVIAALVDALRRGGGTSLLHGVTGSGKTLVYLELLKAALAQGGGAVVLVPEIALTPQTVASFRQEFGELVAVLHSGLSHGERLDAWSQLHSGEKKIAIGARSAIFAPVTALAVIIVDEEHEHSYKQSTSPRYHARDVAVMRAARAGAVCVLGSATPSLESWANAKGGKYQLLSLPERVGGGVLPWVQVVDLRAPNVETPRNAPPGEAVPSQSPSSEQSARAGSEDQTTPPPPRHVLSLPLLAAIQERLSRQEQIILLLNRRGYSSFALCQDCGDVRECPRCSVALTLHKRQRHLLCHHCGHSEEPPASCAQCGSPVISYRGLGTEQVERILLESLPGARVARMDVDTTGGKWSHHQILGRLRDGTVDILLGTQMIAKGLDFHRVTLVGVINADVGLHMPDFRSSERTFQLIAQVAGRAGRGRLPGEVIIQTYVPDHRVIRAALAHDYLSFAKRELELRADPAYPPEVRLARILISSPSQADTLSNAEALARWLGRRIDLGSGLGQPQRTGADPISSRHNLELLGPAPAPIERIKGRYRWHLFLRGSASAIGRALTLIGDQFSLKGKDLRLDLDRDPMSLM